MIGKIIFKDEESKKIVLDSVWIPSNVKKRYNYMEIQGALCFDLVTVKYLGLSRIDKDILIGAKPEIINKILNCKDYYGIKDIIEIKPLEDNSFSYYNPAYKDSFKLSESPVKKEIKRVYSEIDPYGEEDWDNELDKKPKHFFKNYTTYDWTGRLDLFIVL